MPLARLDSQKEDEMVDYFRRKYAETSAADRFGEGEGMSDEITQQGLLPGVKYVVCDFILWFTVVCLFRDPNLWLVKCRQGEEKTTAVAMMRKFIAYQFQEEVKKS